MSLDAAAGSFDFGEFGHDDDLLFVEYPGQRDTTYPGFSIGN